ncbi:hypothetical protein BJX63DRAFT_430599 [Aspergillus granulosus]|uniref:Uncharacterized protein n=1 Tax=Aspergillus granulosus TaxID=176169 RepID=A0ABR4HJK5_9EURO
MLSQDIYRPVGLLLDKEESKTLGADLMGHHYSSIFTGNIEDDVYHGLWEISQGHVGLITSLCNIIAQLANNDLSKYRHTTLNWAAINNCLLRDPRKLFDKLDGTGFARGLPEEEALQDIYIADVLLQAITFPRPLTKKTFVSVADKPKLAALEYIWAHGWLQHEANQQKTIEYMFPTELHKWYCTCAFSSCTNQTDSCKYSTLFDVVVAAVRKFNRRQLSDAKRNITYMADPTSPQLSPLEDQYGKEFYRALRMVKSWAIKLLRNSDRVKEHLKRFEADGQYGQLIKQHPGTDWIVLNFTVHNVKLKRPAYLNHLYHVVFTNDFRIVHILDADLVEKGSFALLEKKSSG